MKSRWRLAIVAATVAITVAAAVVALRGAPPEESEAPRAAPSASLSASAAFNGTDAAWLQLMIALDEGALALVDLSAQRTEDGALRSLVLEIGADQRAELVELRRLGARANLPATNEHTGHEMPGMVTAARLARIQELPAESFTQTVRETLREYLAQCVNLAASEQKSGSEPETRRLAERIAHHRSTHLTQLKGG